MVPEAIQDTVLNITLSCMQTRLSSDPGDSRVDV